MPAAPTSAVEFLDLIRKSGVLPPDRLAAAVPDPTALPAEPPKAAAVLVRNGVLTRFQAQQLLAGRHKGFRLGAYAVLDQLGRGGMGAVYLAEHLELRRKVALKVLLSGKEADQKLAVERFLREARAAAALDHPNIVRIFDVSRHGDVPYLVMEYVDGETLQQVLDRDGIVPYTTAADFVAQAAAGLQHAHEKGFVHRDIKPGNLIRDRSGTVKILDMGLARSSTSERDKLTEKLDAGAVVGTADYIAPEQALNTPSVDIRADIYSLGATFFALVSGKPPFEGNTAQKLLHHQVTAAPNLANVDATLPKGLAGVAAKMLAKKPADRYQTPAEVIAALAPWLGNSTRILAGLSKTNLGAGVELHATLHELGRRNSGRLTAAPAVPDDSAEVNPGETGAVAVAETTRAPAEKPTKRQKKAEKPAKAGGVSRGVLFGALSMVALAGGGVAAYLAFGNPPRPVVVEPNPEDLEARNAAPLPPPKVTAAPAPDPRPAPKEQPKAAPQPKPKDPPNTAAADKPLLRGDFAAVKPFVVRSTIEVSATNPNQKTAKVLSQTGDTPPKGWTARCYLAETHMEFFAEAATGGPALGVRNVKGPGSAMLFTPEFDCPTGVCRLKYDYAASVRAGKFAVRFKPTKPSGPAWDVDRPAVTGQLWATKDVVVNLKGATAGYFEFHNTDETPDLAVKVRNLTVTPAPAGAPSTVTQPAPSAPSGPDYSKWAEGPLVYRLDVAGIAPFRVTKGGGQPAVGEPEKLPPGVSCNCWKATARGEFRRADLDGVPALGLTNLSNDMSAQFSFELEKTLKVVLRPGVVYRVKVSYQTRNEAAGNLAVQTQDYKGVASAKLTGSGGTWKDAAVAFERKDGVPVRLTIDNTTVGEGNTLYFRSVEVVELIAPGGK
ncbi:MAG: protein kinase [Gemmataceae bacterium]|nr:protein kinase [Gemmataceae bacterium]